MTIPDRALLECFYGPLWSDEARASAMRAAALHGATSFVYGPAADLRTGERWREPYDSGADADIDRLVRIVEIARESGLQATWRVSPGAPLARDAAMSMADEDDLQLLRQRAAEIIGLGFDRILVAFDDLDTCLDPVTRSAFGHDRHPMAAAQASVLNSVHRTVADLGGSLLVCPTHYWGTEPSGYRSRFGELLDPELAVCWTGPSVTSALISLDQVRTVSEQFGHPLWIWDNFPVNDWDGTNGQFVNDMQSRRLPLSPLRGRSADLDGAIAGYGTNGALQALAGLPAVCTALDWARDTAAYDADRSFRRALAGARDVDALARLADLAGASPTNAGVGGLAREVIAVLSGPQEKAARHLDHQLGLTEDAVRSLQGAMGGELQPWLDGLAVALPAARSATRVLAARSQRIPPDSNDLAIMRRARSDWPEVALADDALRLLVEHALGIAGAGAPTWPDETLPNGNGPNGSEAIE